MQRGISWNLGSEMQVKRVACQNGHWLVSASGKGKRSCPSCGTISKSRHSWHARQLQDLPVQGEPVVLRLKVARWRCGNSECEQKTFVERLASATPFARRTRRVADLVRVFAHAAGGLVSERLLARLVLSVSDNTILRHLTQHVATAGDGSRVVGIDDWSQRKGMSYGTIIVDLERRAVLDVLPGRSMKGTAEWLKRHPDIEIISRDRCGLYARASREAAPLARQVADRFHLLQNLRDAIETQMTHVSRFAGRSLLPARRAIARPMIVRRGATLERRYSIGFRSCARRAGVSGKSPGRPASVCAR
jgi:transposase